MCVVSNISDYYRPDRTPPFAPVFPSFPSIPEWPPKPTNPNDWDEKRKAKLRELIKIARELDEMNGEPNCESPEKSAWLADFMRSG